MLLIIGIILLVLFFAGMLTSFTLGGFIWVLLIIAVIFILVRIIRGKQNDFLLLILMQTCVRDILFV